MRSTAPRTLLSAGVLTAVLALSACTGDPAENAAPPAADVPAAVANTVVTDVGQYLVEPQGVAKEVIDGTVAKLATMPGVQTARLNAEGFVDVVFEPGSTPDQRAAVVKQMAALGEVIEGV